MPSQPDLPATQMEEPPYVEATSSEQSGGAVNEVMTGPAATPRADNSSTISILLDRSSILWLPLTREPDGLFEFPIGSSEEGLVLLDSNACYIE